SAGVQSAFSSFRKRDRGAAGDPWSAPSSGDGPAPSWSPRSTADASSASESSADAAAKGADGTVSDAAAAAEPGA
ncbi:MAG: hypothetical protein WCN81_10205, partial [Actinomycetes bacterium]